ncbi:MAG: ATP-binding cassette domain-containing protein, partial [Bacteroidales bacterium]|nr:ATP-binding cassette domain-containing protein [Bacteroidales bacterium]
TVNNLLVSHRKGINIIDSLDVAFQKNKIHGIVGLNGSGKTTFFNAFFGLKKIQKGTIICNNQPVTKNGMAYLPTENFFYSNITGQEYLSLFCNPNFDIDRWNSLFKLPLDQITDIYSTGMKKKLAILGVIKQNMPIMLLDEPFNGIDIEMCRILRLVLLKLKETEKTIIVSSHVMDTLTHLCDFIHYLEDGKIKYSIQKEDFTSFEKEIFSLIDKNNKQIINELVTAE